MNLLKRLFSIRRLESFSFFTFFVAALLGGLMLGYIVFSVESKKDLLKLESFRPSLPTRLYDAHGKLIAELFQHKWELAYLKDIPRPVIAAFLAVEDNNFYNHFGIDFMGILRAAWANLKAGRVVQGGSTLTQQLAKGLSGKNQRNIYRKLYEAILALQIENEFSKDEILEMYFNQIYLGHGTIGIASAARFYFDKPVQKLNVIEGAVLAALPKAPHSYSPFKKPQVARKKNKIVLRKMVQLGYLGKNEAEVLYKEFWPKYWKKIVMTPPSISSFGNKIDKAPYFTEYVRRQLVGQFGKEMVYGKGLQVYTTLDLFQQKVAERLMRERLKKQDPIARNANRNYKAGIDYTLLSLYKKLRGILPLPGIIKKYSFRKDYRKKFKAKLSDALEIMSLALPVKAANDISTEFLSTTREFKSDLKVQGAFIAMNPNNGMISVMIGGREFKASSQYNRAIQARRQPGSAFKPFVYGAALEDRAVHYSMGFLDAPIMNIQPDGTMWAPVNYVGHFRGNVLLHQALSRSLNMISVQVYDLIGPDKVIDFASKLMKIPPERFQPNPSLALGSSEVTPLELLHGYSVLTNGGKAIIPHSIIYVTDRDGNVIYNQESQIYDVLNYKKKIGKLQVIEKEVAFIIRKMMENVVNHGTAIRVRREGHYYGPVAGKTGTTSSWNDAWFGGSTGELAAVGWIGLDNGSMSLGRHQAGGNIVAPLWGEFMRIIYKKKGKNPKPFSQKPPKKVQRGSVCKYTGKWPNPECDKKEDLVSTLYAPPIKIGKRRKAVHGSKCDCNHVETKNFLELIQEENQITDEELEKDKKFYKLILDN